MRLLLRVGVEGAVGVEEAWEEAEEMLPPGSPPSGPRVVEGGGDETGGGEDETSEDGGRTDHFRRRPLWRLAPTRRRRRRNEDEPAKDGDVVQGGWVRVFPEAAGAGEEGAPWDEGEGDQVGTLVHLAPGDTAADVCRTLNLLPQHHTVWVQYGGGTSRRLSPAENPLLMQDDFLRQLGYGEASRRARLSIDPELRHLVRFHIGPSIPMATLEGVTRCGTVLVLKGHAFPHWRPRPVAILGTNLFIFPHQDTTGGGSEAAGGGSEAAGGGAEAAEKLDLSGGHVVGGVSKGGRTMLRVAPAASSPRKPVFLGFEEPRERRVWWRWIARATESSSASDQDLLPSQDQGPEVLDLSSGHLDGRLPSARLLLQASTLQPPRLLESPSSGPRAIDLSGNRLGGEGGGRGRGDGRGAAEPPRGSSLEAPGEAPGVGEARSEEEEDLRVLLSGVRSLRLSGNGLGCVPRTLLRLLRSGPPASPPPASRRHPRGRRLQPRELRRGGVPLQRLDLSDNLLDQLPDDIGKLNSLEWLSAEGNALTAMPSALPRRLRCLLLGKNRIRSLGADGAAGKLTPDSRSGSGRSRKSRDFRGGEEADGGEEEEEGVGGRRRCWEGAEGGSDGDSRPHQLSPSLLEKIDLRSNLLDGDVVLGNYENLRELDLSDNEIERLDVRALRHLSVVQCARNLLVHLSLPGHKLTTLIASQNRLVSLMVEPTPLNLEHLHVSRNELHSLPDWPWERFRHLSFLDASHNRLQTLPHRLHVAPNLSELHLHGNRIHSLHEGFLSSPSLQVINLSSNRLSGGLPPLVLGSDGLLPWSSPLLSLRLTGNNLTDAIWEALSELTALTVLHLAYNSLTTVPEKCVEMWVDMEELVVSGNMLSFLPDSIGQLQKLRTLRAHSNKLQQPPKGLSKLNNLRVLDLSHNQLERVNLGDLVPQRLSFLDLSCNPRLHVDPSQFNSYRSQRKMSLVDVSGNNRTSLPSAPYHEAGESYQTIEEGCEDRSNIGPPWKVGFSETPGDLDRLYTTQIRLPAFCNTEGLFGLFDGGSVREGGRGSEGGGGAEAASLLATLTPRILLEERTVKETANDYMKYTLLSAHRELKEKGQKFGACAILCHITAKSASCASVGKASGNSNGVAHGESQQQYTLRVASVGCVGAILCRKDGSLLPLTAPVRSHDDGDFDADDEQEEKRGEGIEGRTVGGEDLNALGMSSSFPQVVPDPHVVEVDLSADRDLCIIIANKIFWSSVQQKEASSESLRMLKPNPDGAQGIDEMITAKRLQDLAQGYGNTGNLSIAVVHLFISQDKKGGDCRGSSHDAVTKSLRVIQRNGTTDLLMKELKEELRTHHHACVCHCCPCSWAAARGDTKGEGNKGGQEPCRLCLPHSCHRRWCAPGAEERTTVGDESSLSNGVNSRADRRGGESAGVPGEGKAIVGSDGVAEEEESCREKAAMAGDVDEAVRKLLPDRSSPSGQSDDAPPHSSSCGSAEAKGKKKERKESGVEEKCGRSNSDRQNTRHNGWEGGEERGGGNGVLSNLRRVPGAWDVCVGAESVLMREKGLHKVSALPALVMSDVVGGGAEVEEGAEGEEGSEVGGVEERFKCWEYMLEQNTQLLFDKELDTLSRGIVRGRSRAPWGDGSSTPSNAAPNSSGPPQYRPPPPAPFLSRRFSSARGAGGKAAGGSGSGWGKSGSVSGAPKWGGGSGRGPDGPPPPPPIQGGPNAAYFGSLQRLLPGHVGFDFEAVRERRGSSSEVQGDSLSEGAWEKDGEGAENRMQAYWGVATTEL